MEQFATRKRLMRTRNGITYQSQSDVLIESINDALNSYECRAMNREELEHELTFLSQHFNAAIWLRETSPGHVELERSRLKVRAAVHLEPPLR